MVLSEKLVDETETRLARSKFRKYLTEVEAEQYVDALCLIGTWVDDRPENEVPNACSDPDDNYLVALYQDSNAHYLVSGDKAVLAIDYANVHVRSVLQVLGDLTFEHVWGPELASGHSAEFIRDVAAEGNAGILSVYSSFLQIIDSPAAEEWLPYVVVPGTEQAFVSDMAQLRTMLADRGMTTRPDFGSPEIAYLKLPPDPGVSVWATGPMNLPNGTIFATMQRCPDAPEIEGTAFDGWRVFAIGQPVPVERVPPRPSNGST